MQVGGVIKNFYIYIHYIIYFAFSRVKEQKKHNSTRFCLRCGVAKTAAVSHRGMWPVAHFDRTGRVQTNWAPEPLSLSQICLPQCRHPARSVLPRQGGLPGTTWGKQLLFEDFRRETVGQWNICVLPHHQPPHTEDAGARRNTAAGGRWDIFIQTSNTTAIPSMLSHIIFFFKHKAELQHDNNS